MPGHWQAHRLQRDAVEGQGAVFEAGQWGGGEFSVEMTQLQARSRALAPLPSMHVRRCRGLLPIPPFQTTAIARSHSDGPDQRLCADLTNTFNPCTAIAARRALRRLGILAVREPCRRQKTGFYPAGQSARHIRLMSF